MSKKTHTYMTPEELDIIRIAMGCKWVDLEILLGIKHRTLQGYSSGTRGIPKEFADKMRSAFIHDRETTQQAIRKAVKQFDAQFPHGIVSEVTE